MVNELKLGDIIVFKAEKGEWISQCIALLTDSDTSHAAMVYEQDAIVEQIAKGTSLNKIAASEGEEAYVLRLKPSKDAAPLIHAASTYLAEHIKYDFPALVILGVLLISRKIMPTHSLFFIIDKIILAACAELDRFIQKVILKNPKGMMVCSQLVYQIYYDCGLDYKIQVKNGNLWKGTRISRRNKNASNEVLSGVPREGNTICLLDLLEDIEESELLTFNSVPFDTPTMLYENSIESVEELAQQLYEALEENLQQMNEPLDAAPFLMTNDIAEKQLTNNVLRSTQTFLSHLEMLQQKWNLKMPVEAMFIMPGDFVYHAHNLEKVGTINIKRVN